MVFAFAARTLRLRCFAQSGFVAVTLLAAVLSDRCSYAQVVDLRATSAAGSHQQVRVILEVEGKLKLNTDGKEVQHVPIKATAELQYVERALQAGKQASGPRAARHYQKAEAKIRLRDTDLTNSLREDRRLIVLDGDRPLPVLFSPLGPLTREELELIEAPGSSLPLGALLPGRPIKIGSQWELASAAVERLLGLEAVSQQNVVGTLQSVEKEVAIASLEGKVAGAVGGVSSDIELKGKLNYDLRKRTVTWLALAIKETRAIGHAQPGFEVLTRLRMVAVPSGVAAEVADKALAGLPTAAESGQALIDLTAEKAGFQLVHDRRWRVMVERHDTTILRLVDRGDLIAQCNISPLPALPKDKELPLEGYQNDVKQALGSNFGQVVEAAQEAGEDGIVIQRVTVSGTVGELPIQWTYYHLTDDKGHRAAVVFTIEGNLVERFAQIDRELISGFRFLPDKQPTPALNAPEEKSAEKPAAGTTTK
jgi:hypothetical protein